MKMMKGNKVPEATQKQSKRFPFCFVFILFSRHNLGPFSLFFFALFLLLS